MNVLLEIVIGLGGILLSLINIYIWIIIINALLSFVNPDPYNPIVQLLNRVTQPAYNLVRKFIPTTFNGLDLAPLIIIIVLQVLMVIMSSFLRNL